MQFVTTTITQKSVIDGMTEVVKVSSTKLTPPAVVVRHPKLTLVAVFFASKKVGETIRDRANRPRTVVHNHYHGDTDND